MLDRASASSGPTDPQADAKSPTARPPSPRAHPSPIRVLLVEDHAVVRTALRLVIEHQFDMRVVGEAGTGEQAVEAARELKPDVVVMDVLLPGIDGAEATERIRKALPDTRVIALTACEEKSRLRQLLRSGASGYVVKRSSAAELCQAIRTAAAGGVHIDPLLAPYLVDSFLGTSGDRQPQSSVALSDRETAVLQLIALGYTHREIAQMLCVSTKTVDTYRARVSEKLGLESRVDFVRLALSKGLLAEQPFGTRSAVERYRRGRP